MIRWKTDEAWAIHNISLRYDFPPYGGEQSKNYQVAVGARVSLRGGKWGPPRIELGFGGSRARLACLGNIQYCTEPLDKETVRLAEERFGRTLTEMLQDTEWTVEDKRDQVAGAVVARSFYLRSGAATVSVHVTDKLPVS